VDQSSNVPKYVLSFDISSFIRERERERERERREIYSLQAINRNIITENKFV
jgi:hypothetical protein